MFRGRVAFAGGVAVASVAFAEPPPAEIEAIRSPGFVTIDRFDATSRLGAEMSYLFPKASPLKFLRVEPHAQYVDRKTGMGAYVSLPIACSIGESGTVAASDLEIGAFSAPRIHPNVGVVFRAGITLPTGSTSAERAATNFIAGESRITDSYLAIPKGTSLRFGVSPLVRWGPLFARVDLGFDANLMTSDGLAPTGPRAGGESVIRVNAGLGIDLEQVAVMGEIANVHAFGHSGWNDTGAISLRAKLRDIQPYAALVFPLPIDGSATLSGALTFGLEVALR